ncbi:MASE1 domain-containing protein [Lysobacter sp. CA199]|uniref:MASE1 domain-containing protein n=1 Tax=Lysobacter sp. CA199 TaxID=3455608 RepID=UPI003F8D2617
MEVATLNTRAKGLIFAVLYCASFLLTWRLSVDQWYLPAGLRAAALLFIPYRYWPFVFAGDTAALLVQRVPKADQYGELWAFLSPFLLLPLISVVPAIFRKVLGELQHKVRWLPLIAIVTAVWSALSAMIVNSALNGPAVGDTLQKFIVLTVGQYLGILMLGLPVAVWLRRGEHISTPQHLGRDIAVAIGLTAGIYLAVQSGPFEPALRQVLLMLMIGPPVALTFMHGWRGAVLGLSIMCVAVGMTLPHVGFQGYAGAHDATAFVAQLALAVAASALFVLGTIISDHYTKARQLGMAEQHALKIAQTSFLSTERHMRDRVIAMAQIQAHLDDSRKQLIQVLKERGHFAAAMDLTRHGVIHSQLFDEHASALYPIRIERQGLFDVLQAEAFSSIWANGAPIRYLLHGRAKSLSVDLQLAAYRSACNAVSLLSARDPKCYTVRSRVWRFCGRQGVLVSIVAAGGTAADATAASTLAALELEGRIKAHGGALRRRHGNSVSYLLAEPVGATEGDQRSVFGADTAQASPFAL